MVVIVVKSKLTHLPFSDEVNARGRMKQGSQGRHNLSQDRCACRLLSLSRRMMSPDETKCLLSAKNGRCEFV